MATVAGHLVVATFKFVFGVLVMIEMNFFPLLFEMTILAFLSVTGLMDVIQAMTGNTGFGDVFVPLIGMATIAGGFLMLSLQREVGLVMIKRGSLGPGLLIVAIGTGIP